MAHSDNHLALARLIYDPVASASTDGVQLTSAQRDTLLNKANLWVHEILLSLGNKENPGMGLEKFAPGLVKSQTISAWSSFGFALPTDYYVWLSAQQDGSPNVRLRFVEPSRKIDLDNNSNPNEVAAFTIKGGKTYGYVDGSILNAGTGVLEYICTDQATNSASTIVIDSIWHDIIVSRAAALYFMEKGEIERATMIMQDVLSQVKFIIG